MTFVKHAALAAALALGIARAQQFVGVDYVIENAIASEITPGAAVVIGSSDSIYYQRAYGRQTYDAGSPATNLESIFDLASLTKVYATTTCVMSLVDSGLIDVEENVATYLPDFGQNGKGNVKVRNLLLHNGGLRAYYSPSPSQSPEDIIDAIYALSLSYPTGSQTVYSCLNFVTLMKVVESVSGMPMWAYYRHAITDRLGMTRTMFTPPDSLAAECMPTARTLQGSVHDPLAAGLDGLSGNAGLFSTAPDLAKISQLLLNGGEYDGDRLFKSSTIPPFVEQYDASTYRAFGWGTNVWGSSSAGSLMGADAFGHTGYTGTCAWHDPTRDLFVVFLTNRVYPDDSKSVTATRAAVNDAAIRAVEGIPPAATLREIVPESDGSLLVEWNNNLTQGPIDRTIFLADTGAGFFEYAELDPDSSAVAFTPGDLPSDEIVSFAVVNKFQDKTADTSDVYCFRGSDNEALIVDGYDRVGGWGKASHPFVVAHAEALPDSIDVASCDNRRVIDGTVELNDYEYVVWLCGDESTSDETLDGDEQRQVREFLNEGGNFFLSGSEIGWDLVEKGANTDMNFYRYYLHADYQGDDAADNNAVGVSGTLFDGLSFAFGDGDAFYIEDYPDYLGAAEGSQVCLEYGNGKGAAIFYEGTFHTYDPIGKLVYFGFPFETIVGAGNREAVMGRVFDFYSGAYTSVERASSEAPAIFSLGQNYPNPFNPTTTVDFSLPEAGFATLVVYNALGEKVATLVEARLPAGAHAVEFVADDLPSGVYVYRLAFGNRALARKAALVK